MSEELKKLTGKNPKDYEPVAFDLVNKPNIELFQELVKHEDFLFDFVKNNVSKRISDQVNASNYLNLLKFLKYYSPSYEECIVSNLVDFAEEDLTDKMLDLFENGTIDEKTYCAKFFSYIQDSLALDYLKSNAYSEDNYLSSNCASTLAILGDREIYNQSVEKLNSEDVFEQLNAVKFLTAYGDKNATKIIMNVTKNSTMPENIAGELLYLTDFFELYNINKTDAFFVLNSIINGLGEILPLSQVFDFKLYETLEYLKNLDKDSVCALTLLHAKEKFDILTENDEYLYDEQKDTKQEISDIKKLLANIDTASLKPLAQKELNENSIFLNFAMDLVCTPQIAKNLIKSTNQTIILKSLEYLKNLDNLTEDDKQTALLNITNEDIKNIVSVM